MDSQPVETQEPRDGDYMAEKLRGAAVMYAPAIVVDLKSWVDLMMPTAILLVLIVTSGDAGF